MTTARVKKVAAEPARETVEITFADDISPETVPPLVESVLAEMAMGKDVTLYISSNGGELMDAVAAYDRLRLAAKRTKQRITTVASGYCMSAGVVLLQAGTHRLALPHTLFLVHQTKQYPWTEGQHIAVAELQARIAVHGLTTDVLVALFAERGNLSYEEWEKMLLSSEEHFFDVRLAEQLGLIDGVLLE